MGQEHSEIINPSDLHMMVNQFEQHAKKQSTSKESLDKLKHLLNASYEDADHYDEFQKEEKEENQNAEPLRADSIRSNKSTTNPNPLKKSVGRIIAKFPCKQRTSLINGTKCTKQIILCGTAFIIGRNLLLTAGHNIYEREYNEMAEEVYFLPEIKNTLNSAALSLIKAVKFDVFDHYKQQVNKYSRKFDVAVVVLEDSLSMYGTEILSIDWSYKQWELRGQAFTLAGYPVSMRVQQKGSFLYRQDVQKLDVHDEFLTYSRTEFGQSGGPLTISKKQNNKITHKVIGFHKGKPSAGSSTSFGIPLNTLENTQEMVYQLIEKLHAQQLFPTYEPSCKLMRQTITKEKNLVQKISKLQQLQEENQRLKKQLIQKEEVIQQLNQQFQHFIDQIIQRQQEIQDLNKKNKWLLEQNSIVVNKLIPQKHNTQFESDIQKRDTMNVLQSFDFRRLNTKSKPNPKNKLHWQFISDSSIIKTIQQAQTLIGFFEGIEIKSVSLLYKASQNFFSTKKYLQTYGLEENTLVICVTNKDKIIGGYSPLSHFFTGKGKIWNHNETNEYQEVQDPSSNSFIFSLTNQHKFHLKPKESAVCRYKDKSQISFGWSEFKICDDSCNQDNCWTWPNKSYINQNYKERDAQTYRRLNGNDSRQFTTREWEVWKIHLDKEGDKSSYDSYWKKGTFLD